MTRLAVRRIAMLFALLALASALAACSPVPRGEPTMSGVMRAVSEDQAGMTVLVYGPGDIDRLAARVDTDTVLLRDVGGRIEPAVRNEVIPGKKADVWVDGPIMETYPLQGHAGTLVIRER